MSDKSPGMNAIRDTLGSAFIGAEAADAIYIQRIAALANVPYARGALDPIVHELIQIALHGTITQFNLPAMSRHIAHALRAGATPSHIKETLQISSVIGIHAATTGFLALYEEASAAGKLGSGHSTEQTEAFRRKFEEARGYWNDALYPLLAVDFEFMEAYLALSAHPAETGTLGAKVRELIYIALDVSVTHMFDPGTRQHIRNAFHEGASVMEIAEVMEIASLVGVHTFAAGIMALNEHSSE